MHYEGRICRPPMERGSFMLPVTVGCPYNRCRFCMLFKHLSYRAIPLPEIEAELARVRSAGGDPATVFLGDGSAFSLGYGPLCEVLRLIRSYFPGCRSVHMDATAESIAYMTDAQLADLRRQGVDLLYLGIESGLEDVLRFMAKDHDPVEARKAIARLSAVGIRYGAHIMTGIAGAGRGKENAEATAVFLNETQPARVINFSLFTHSSSPLWQSVKGGTWSPASVQEALEEERLLLSLLKGPTLYDGFQDRIEFRTRGRLPEDRRRMLSHLDKAIAGLRNEPPLYAIESGGEWVPLPSTEST